MGLAVGLIVFQPMLEAATAGADLLVRAIDIDEGVLLTLLGAGGFASCSTLRALRYFLLGVELDDAHHGFEEAHSFVTEGGYPADGIRRVLTKGGLLRRFVVDVQLHGLRPPLFLSGCRIIIIDMQLPIFPIHIPNQSFG